MLSTYILAAFILKVFVCYAKKDTFFPNNSIVCFVGDSITHKGDFHNNILQYYVTRHANKNIKFCNCGIAGDTAEGGLTRIEEDVMIHNPTHAVIMFGMNDLGKDYNKSMSTRENDIKNDLAAFAENLEKMIIFLQAKSVRVLLEKPTIYDDTAETKTLNMVGRNDILGSVAEVVGKMGQKYSLRVVDYYSIMKRINTVVQSALPNDSIIGPDRIHPGPVGHLIMAYKFLSTVEQPSPLGKIVLYSDLQNSAMASSNCVIRSLEYRNNKSEVEAIIQMNALPFVLAENQRQVQRLVAFNRDFNTQLLRVYNLSKSADNYLLMVDNFQAGQFSAESLERGVDMAHIKRTPQYFQADKVKRTLMQMWKLEENERWVKFVEHCCMKSYLMKNKNVVDIVSAGAYLDDLYKTKHLGNSFMRKSFDTYIKFKPLIAELRVQINGLLSLARELAAPKYRKFLIRPIPKV